MVYSQWKGHTILGPSADENENTESLRNKRGPNRSRLRLKLIWTCPVSMPSIYRVSYPGWQLVTFAVCGVEREDSFHALCRCPLSRPVAMRTVWELPDEELIRLAGPEWILESGRVGAVESYPASYDPNATLESMALPRWSYRWEADGYWSQGSSCVFWQLWAFLLPD